MSDIDELPIVSRYTVFIITNDIIESHKTSRTIGYGNAVTEVHKHAVQEQVANRYTVQAGGE
ncbi:hypothetical protein RI543_003067 [Arxiozyma heterogenica]|uniref:Uncharacterized protein n=1 Tax=Arxiozyma heterogenica TaxID=278026 RepID=A0AAN7W1K6_9SACH|nr:hypothetical protein RI543_003067 [Kazachstania heterogenica]